METSDIVTRLRSVRGWHEPTVDELEAADEIERLRTELARFYERFARELALGQEPSSELLSRNDAAEIITRIDPTIMGQEGGTTDDGRCYVIDSSGKKLYV